MKLAKWLVCLGVAAMAVVGAATSFSVTFLQSAIVGGTELKAGDYRVELDGDKAVIRSGKHMVEAPVKVQTDDVKHRETIVRYNNGDGKYHVSQILIGGSKTTLVFNN
jgi:hypothetical protein